MHIKIKLTLQHGFVRDMREARKLYNITIREKGEQPAMKRALDRNSAGEFIKALEEIYVLE